MCGQLAHCPIHFTGGGFPDQGWGRKIPHVFWKRQVRTDTPPYDGSGSGVQIGMYNPHQCLLSCLFILLCFWIWLWRALPPESFRFVLPVSPLLVHDTPRVWVISKPPRWLALLKGCFTPPLRLVFCSLRQFVVSRSVCKQVELSLLIYADRDACLSMYSNLLCVINRKLILLPPQQQNGWPVTCGVAQIYHPSVAANHCTQEDQTYWFVWGCPGCNWRFPLCLTAF